MDCLSAPHLPGTGPGVGYLPPAVGRSYGLKGQTPVILATGQRFGCNMISAITNQGRLNFMVFKERFTAPVFLEFLRRLLRQSDRQVYLIIDRHPVHRSLKVITG